MIVKIKEFVKKYQADIILVIGVILISLLSFATGYIVAKYQDKTSIKFEQIQNEETKSSHNWSRDFGSLFSLETFGKRT